MNRPDLFALVGHRVTVTTPGPIIADPETGKLVALADEPTLILDLDDGRRRVFLQSRSKVVLAEDTPPAPIPPWEQEVLSQQAAAISDGHTLADKLDRMLANLQAHIDQRANEIAAAHIAHAAAAARAEIEAAQQDRDHWRQRFEDLQHEHQRQVEVLHKRASRAETANARALSTLRLNTSDLLGGRRASGPTDYARGYQACADHVTRALNTLDQEGSPA